jgi:hypothetical protein
MLVGINLVGEDYIYAKGGFLELVLEVVFIKKPLLGYKSLGACSYRFYIVLSYKKLLFKNIESLRRNNIVELFKLRDINVLINIAILIANSYPLLTKVSLYYLVYPLNNVKRGSLYSK